MAQIRNRILIIEDNPADVELLRLAFEEYGLRALGQPLESGSEVLEWLAAVANGSAEVPDLIVTDLNLPIFNGMEVLERLKSTAELARVPIAILTSSDSPQERSHAQALGISAFLRKPMDLDGFLALGATFQRLLSESAGTGLSSPH